MGKGRGGNNTAFSTLYFSLREAFRLLVLVVCPSLHRAQAQGPKVFNCKMSLEKTDTDQEETQMTKEAK